ncbi:MAG: leucine--tRNA ligase [Candidatus Bathyarchaeota archaeon]
MSLDWRAIEKKWQRRWEEARVFETDPKIECQKLFLTVAYPYPNSPQHVGHGRTFTLTDVYARFKRMQGYNVLFPMAFHYTGTPVLAIAKRITSGDKELINDFVDIYKVPPEVLKTFSDPVKIADYFRNEIKQGMREVGYSIDWRREFTTIDATYSRFIEWQFRKLKSKGLITRGSHPVGWCQNCENPMGQHDTQGDIEPEIGELTVIKFKFGEAILPTGTLRPETIFGVTNIWIRPDREYVKVDVNGEIWIVSNECVNKLELLERKVIPICKINGKDLVGNYVVNPVTEEKIPIFPASFVDPMNATGVVMSVPAHAPYDYIALEDFKKAELMQHEFGLKPETLMKVKPIALISLDGYSQFPAVDIVARLAVKKQTDIKLEEATKAIYSQELRHGRMKENTGKYSGLSVADARERIRTELLQSKKAEMMYDLLNRPVYCRCGSEVAVKIFKDQWFIDYSNSEWKTLAHKSLNKMRIFPEELRVEFGNVINWLREKACARKQGLGTKLPWDPQWIIESLSDSVIYMSYYTIAKHIKEHQIDADKLNDAVFNYIFLGEGDPSIIAKEKNLNPSLLREMRDEFVYFYPLDNRGSGRDLVPNHLTFFIFNHAAIFPEENWPRQIVVNGSVLMEGKKMSKSFGNIIPLRDALRSYGADPFRLAILATAELLQDADFSNALAKSLREKLERFYSFAMEIIDMGERGQGESISTIDLWLQSRLQQRVMIVTVAIENMRFREAINNSLYMLDQDIQWYLRRSISNGKPKGIPQILKQVLETRVALLAPFAPHLCEEIWEKLEKPLLVCSSKWPIYDEKKIDVKIIEGEELIKNIRDDIASIIDVTKTAPKKILLYTAAAWKWRIYEKNLKKRENQPELHLNMRDSMRDVMADSELKTNVENVSVFVQKMVTELNKMPVDVVKKRMIIGVLDEMDILTDARNFYEREFNSEIVTQREDAADCYDPKDRTKLAQPYRPAIYIE